MELWYGPLGASIAQDLIEHRLAHDALSVLRKPEATLAWRAAVTKRFDVLLARSKRCRNAVIHGQRPSLGVPATVDTFVRDLGRLVAHESLRAAETGDAPLVQLERWRAELAEQRGRLEAGEAPLTVLFDA